MESKPPVIVGNRDYVVLPEEVYDQAKTAVVQNKEGTLSRVICTTDGQRYDVDADTGERTQAVTASILSELVIQSLKAIKPGQPAVASVSVKIRLNTAAPSSHWTPHMDPAERRCVYCGTTARAVPSLGKCSQCHQARYCKDTTCQRDHWPLHQSVCRGKEDAKRAVLKVD